MRAIVLLVAFAASLGCSRNQVQLATAQSISDLPCDPARIPDMDASDWRVINGDGFTYCVPADWQAVGPRAERWRSPAADLSWSDRPATETARLPESAARVREPAPFGSRYLTEQVDGRTVRLHLMDGGTTSAWMASAAFLEPSLHFQATARTPDASRAVIAVVRSVRFPR